MNSFVEKFKGEVREYCERLEIALLLLEHDRENQQLVDEIFRIMHTMKGSGGMFGFDLLSEVTHDLESFYEIFRSKKHPIDSEAISFTLNSIDILQNLLKETPAAHDRSIAEKLKADTRQQIARFNSAEFLSKEHETILASAPTTPIAQDTWYISFIPDKDILKNGTNPLFLIDELNALGECNVQVSFDGIPSLEQLDPECCYSSWNLFIATQENIETLKDVFIFVNDKSDIQFEKVASDNVIHQENILAAFLNAKLNQEKWVPADAKIQVPETVATEEEPSNSTSEDPQETLVSNVFLQPTVDSVRVDSQKIDNYMNLVSELITAQSRLELISSKLAHPDLEIVTEAFGKLSRQLRDNAFDMSLMPLQSITTRFKRLIHDLSKSLDKEVVLVTHGMETELDKNIIEKLIEPLLHIIRNCIDHGIENKEERLAKQKSEAGTIQIKASTAGSSVLIEIEDDGAGLDLVTIRKKALENDIINDQLKLSDNEIAQLIFEPGFSTAELVTDVSGRGVGMDVVKRRVQELRGIIELDTKKNKFTRITIRLPLSLSIIDGLLVKVGDGYYVIPLAVIKKIHFIKRKSLKKGFKQVVELEDNQIPYLNLNDEFLGGENAPKEQLIVVVGSDNQLFGLIVDEVIHEYQAVIKPLGRLLKEQDIFSGASILGTGELALVIDTNKLIKKYL